MLQLTLLLVLLMAGRVVEVHSAATASVTNAWPTGFDAKVELPVTQTLDGWKIHVVFDKPVDSLTGWNEDSTKISDTEFILTNVDYNAHIDSGTTFLVDMQGKISGDPPSQVCVYWEGIEPADACLLTTITSPGVPPGSSLPPGVTGSTVEPSSTSGVPLGSSPTPAGTTDTVEPYTSSTPDVPLGSSSPSAGTSDTMESYSTPGVPPSSSSTPAGPSITVEPYSTPGVPLGSSSPQSATSGPGLSTSTAVPLTTSFAPSIATSGPDVYTDSTYASPGFSTPSLIPSSPGLPTATSNIPVGFSTLFPVSTNVPPVPGATGSTNGMGVSTNTPAGPASSSAPVTFGSSTTAATLTTRLPGPAGSKDYAKAIALSQMFYDAQRSGKLPADNPIPWRNDSALTDCVVGGWYDAGDHVKFGFPMAGALTMLLWGVDRFKDGYEAAGQLDKMYDTVKWGLDYLLNAWNPFTQELVGDGDIDHQYWGRPEDMTMPRPCVKIGPGRPGSDVAGETVAALAAGALVFEEKGDLEYAATLLETAQSIYRFALENRGLYTDMPPTTQSWYYPSTSDKDEMCEAGVWLYRATGDESYLVNAKREHEGIIPTELSWDDKTAACDLLLYNTTHGNQRYRRDVENFLSSWQPGGDKLYTPCGFVWGNSTYWGSARHAANVAFAALLAAEDGIDPEVNRKWAAEQINYLLGDNPHDGGCFSYEIGYGSKYPLQPHHRAASCPDPPAPCSEADNLHVDAPSPHILYGGLVGGPIYNDGYNDTREDYVHNEVALDYNAGFQSALAGLMPLVSTDQFPDTRNICPCTQ
ncbi:hypothetical protein BaRGS_00027356 [Batillaria attramentaria]|uniref:Endoglucanase n=1 Tax=Batillaria attramentaria TaxID=370345 RepID=A0ABD0K1X4_9CAEN